MSIVRRRYYRGISFDQDRLRNLVGPSATVLAATSEYVDVSVDDSTGGIIEGLDEAMAGEGLYYDASPRVTFHATSRIVGKEVEITNDETFEGVGGGIVTNPGFFASSLAHTFGRVTCAVKTVGLGAQLKTVEDGLDGSPMDMTSAPFEFPDTEGEWRMFNINTNVPPHTGDHEYGIQLKRGGATSFHIRSAHMTLLEVVQMEEG